MVLIQMFTPFLPIFFCLHLHNSRKTSITSEHFLFSSEYCSFGIILKLKYHYFIYYVEKLFMKKIHFAEGIKYFPEISLRPSSYICSRNHVDLLLRVDVKDPKNNKQLSHLNKNTQHLLFNILQNP